MDAPRTVLLLFVILFILLSPESQQPTLSQQREVGRLISEERHALAVLNESRYGDLDAAADKWLNVTGLRAEDGYVWDALPKVQERAREQLWGVLRDEGFWRLDGHKDDRTRKMLEKEGKMSMSMNRSWTEEIWGDMLPIYQNATGIVRGEWVKSPVGAGIRAPRINLTEVVPELLLHGVSVRQLARRRGFPYPYHDSFLCVLRSQLLRDEVSDGHLDRSDTRTKSERASATSATYSHSRSGDHTTWGRYTATTSHRVGTI